MSAIADRGRAAMQWMLLIGLVSLWASIDQSPQVVDTARVLFESLLSNAQIYGSAEDPLAQLPDQSRTALSQYRFEFLRPGLMYDRSLLPAKRESMGQISLETVLAFSRQALDDINSREVPGLARPLIDRNQALIAKLEAWQQKSGLGTMATLGDIQAEVASRIQVPGTDQTIALDRCMSLLGLAIVGLQLYLTSLLMTLCETNQQGSTEVDRSWILLHRAPLGPFLATLTIATPTLIWLWRQIIVPLGESGVAPSASCAMIALAAALATAMSLFETRQVRRQLLAAPAVSAWQTTAFPNEQGERQRRAS